MLSLPPVVRKVRPHVVRFQLDAYDRHARHTGELAPGAAPARVPVGPGPRGMVRELRIIRPGRTSYVLF